MRGQSETVLNIQALPARICRFSRHIARDYPLKADQPSLAKLRGNGQIEAMKKRTLSKEKLRGAKLARSRTASWVDAGAGRTASAKVDDIFQQWRAERPDIDPSPVQIYGLICQLYLQTTAFINAALEPYGLYRGTFDVLTALRRAGAPYLLTPKQLSAELLLSAAGLTSRLNALEERHLIARLPEPNDRRTVRIQLTVAGEALVNKVIPVVFDAQWARLHRLGKPSRQRLAVELKRFADVVSESNASDAEQQVTAKQLTG
jgi:DNA-binding MarR family transcriptional regulator